jgi:hypothetical protein
VKRHVLLILGALLGLVTAASFLRPRAYAVSAADPPPGIQSQPALAAAGGTTYALWSDTRDGGSRLWWTRLDAQLPDSLAARLTEAPAGELHAAVAAGSTWALAAWESWTDSGTRLAAAELPATGPPGTAQTTLVTSGPGPVWRPASAIRGDVGVLAWEDERQAPGDLYYARWDRGAGLRDPGGLPLATGPADQRWVRVAAGGEGFLAVWSAAPDGVNYSVTARFLDPGGEPVGAPRALSGPVPGGPDPDAAAMGPGFLVVWRDDGNLVGRYTDPTGNPLASGSFAVVTSSDFDYLPRLAAAATGAHLAWMEISAAGRGLRRAWLDGAGTAHPAGGLPVTDPADYVADPALAAGTVGAILAWRLPTPDDADDLYAEAVADGDTTSIPPPVLLSVSTGNQSATVFGESKLQPQLHVDRNPFGRAARLTAPGVEPGEVLEILDVRGRRVCVLRSGGGGWR